MRTPFVTPYKTLYIPGSIIAKLVERLYSKGIKVNRIEASPPTGRTWQVEVRIEDFDYVDRLAQFLYLERNFFRAVTLVVLVFLLMGTLNGLF